MKPLLIALSLMFLAGAAAPALSADAVGVRTIAVASAERGENLAVTVWYPAAAGGKTTLLGEGRVFQGAPAFADAPALPGPFPLILVSHGSGGRIRDLGWIARPLVEAGFVVAGPNHPGTTSGDSTPADTPKLWERTRDMSDVLTALTTEPEWRASVEAGRIGVLGFSLGGATALELVGARANREAYAHYCDTYPTMPDCAWFAGGKGFVDGAPVTTAALDLRMIDKARFEQSNLDRRIRAAVLVDPSVAQAYDAGSLREIAIPLQFINLGRPANIPVAVKADALASLTPQGRYAQVDDAVHFSFLALCQPDGAAFLKSVGDTDTVCDDGGIRQRADIHAELTGLITSAFTTMLKPGM
ncbi:dienelactone hydrolase family protein [Kaistia dalseonensis]|uniref:Dienelactone hydrolase n=1 Tax=Kaistia dalseonensis TaxID=410840 RepID=A0ABU0H2N0_9HYPH|nr:dienelactone hydrolase family protein [Kaistia dalseonensis]MCX5493988.1 dienelactone hydrolase family protein [Kaistia dalseonensis]MDQ0436564.1 putative dienelactone hydrolase [Kaistia dalseonensis]